LNHVQGKFIICIQVPVHETHSTKVSKIPKSHHFNESPKRASALRSVKKKHRIMYTSIKTLVNFLAGNTNAFWTLAYWTLALGLHARTSRLPASLFSVVLLGCWGCCSIREEAERLWHLYAVVRPDTFLCLKTRNLRQGRRGVAEAEAAHTPPRHPTYCRASGAADSLHIAYPPRPDAHCSSAKLLNTDY
jgi:hypothetical protein